jgi:hypothetical protein
MLDSVVAALFGPPSLARPFALRTSFASVARDLGRCDHDYPRWGVHTPESTTPTSSVLGAPASLMGSELPQYPR